MRDGVCSRMAVARRFACFVALLATLCSVNARAEVPGSMPLVASGDGHLWWVVERAPSAASGDASQADTPFLLMHHALNEPTPTERLVMRFANEPEALAAEGNALVVVARAQGKTPRMVLSMTAVQSSVGGHWYTQPKSGPQVLSPLVDAGTIRDLALSDGVLYALVRAASGTSITSGTSGTNATNGTSAPTSTIRLLSLSINDRSSDWHELGLPPLDAQEPLRLVSSHDGLAVLGSVGGIGSIAECETGPEVGPALEWTLAPLDGVESRLDARSVLGAFEVDRHLAVVARRGALVDGGPATLELSLRRRGALTPWAAFVEPAGRWALTSFGPDAALLTQNSDRIGVLQLIPLSATAPAAAITLAPPGFTGGNWIHIPIIAAAAIALVLLALVFGADAYLDQRIHEASAVKPISAQRRPGARLGHRAWAMLIDLVPAAILTWLVFRGNPLEYFEFPVFVTDLNDRLPAIITVALGWLSASVGDVFFGRSLGKKLAGLEIIAIRGGPSTVGRRALRSLASLVTLAAPPVMLIASVNPRGDGPAEMVSGTAVVMEVRTTDLS